MARHDEERLLIVGASQRLLLLRRKPLLGARALRLRPTCRECARQQQHQKRKRGT
jgi:hypothetical protein